jgi:hypothetical protein
MFQALREFLRCAIGLIARSSFPSNSRRRSAAPRIRGLISESLECRTVLSGMVVLNYCGTTEGNGSGEVALTVTAVYSGDPTPFSVDYETYDMEAVGGTDYVHKTGTLQFSGADGQEVTFTVNVTRDSIVELDEHFGIRLLNASVADINLGSTGAWIGNDDSASIELILSPAFLNYPAEDGVQNESEAGNPMRYRIVMTGQVDVPVEVDWEIYLGDTEIADYSGARSGTVTLWAASNPDYPVFIWPTNDGMVEGDEGFGVVITDWRAQGREFTLL